MRKTLKLTTITFGALVSFAGLSVAAAAVAIFATVGSDGTVHSGRQAFATPSAALVSSVADLRRPGKLADIVGDPRVQLSVDSAKPVFVGVGPAKDVERYLAGAAVDEVSDFEVDPFKLDHHPRGGTALPKPPGKQAFWIAQGSGARGAKLDWKAGSGQYRLVVMNADGSRGVVTNGEASVTIPHAAPIAWSLLGGGLLVALGGLATMLSATRRRGLATPAPVGSRAPVQGVAPMPRDDQAGTVRT